MAKKVCVIRFAAVLLCAAVISACQIAVKPGSEPFLRISFDGNGAPSGQTAAISVRGGQKAVLPQCGFTAPDGKVFAWWNTKEDGTGDKWHSGEGFPAEKNDAKFYAVWVNSYNATNYAAITSFDITAPAQLAQIAGLANDLTSPRDFALKTVKLLNDIDMGFTSGFTGVSSGSGGALFNGTFDGDGKVIRNLRIEQPESGNIGLFGRVGGTGRVQNVRLEGGSVTAKEFAGSLAGVNSGVIENCSSAAAVNAAENTVGGLVGQNLGTITSSYYTGAVTGGGSAVGGLAGSNGGSIADSYNTGTVTGQSCTGGIVGVNGGSLTRCYNIGTLAGKNSTGGIAGEGRNPSGTGSITSCFSLKANIGAAALSPVGFYVSGTVKDCESIDEKKFLLADFSATPYSWATAVWTQKTDMPAINGVTERPVLIANEEQGSAP